MVSAAASVTIGPEASGSGGGSVRRHRTDPRLLVMDDPRLVDFAGSSENQSRSTEPRTLNGGASSMNPPEFTDVIEPRGENRLPTTGGGSKVTGAGRLLEVE